MHVSQTHWTQSADWQSAPAAAPSAAQLVLVFGAKRLLAGMDCIAAVKRRYPGALVAGCSTAGEIHGTQVADETVVVTSVTFDHTRVAEASVSLGAEADSFDAGRQLAEVLPGQFKIKNEKLEMGVGRDRPEARPTTGAVPASLPLRHVLILSDGHSVNGSELVRALSQFLPAGVTITGGMAGDGIAFGETLVLAGGRAQSRTVTAIGFYGSRLRVGFSSMGGWDPFGPERLITKSKGNVLYELDGHSALELYKKYLGEHARELPSSALHFPLSVRPEAGGTPLVRTILSIDEATQSMTFAGDVPQGSLARLMKANHDRLIDGAVGAARASYEELGSMPGLAVLISCVGRKLVLGQRVEEELEGVAEVFGKGTALAGFYSYGELSPFVPGAPCALHNQTMTVTTFTEVGG